MNLIEIVVIAGVILIMILVCLPFASYIWGYMQMSGKINAIKKNPNNTENKEETNGETKE